MKKHGSQQSSYPKDSAEDEYNHGKENDYAADPYDGLGDVRLVIHVLHLSNRIHQEEGAACTHKK